MRGKVKWFNSRRTFGFITPDDGGTELFVHVTGLALGGGHALTLAEGQRVEYEVIITPRGPRAENVKTI